MASRRATLLRALAGLAALGASCGGAAAPERPDVVLVVADTLRADRLTCQGGPDGLTPYIDRIAAAGVRFAEARAHAPWTLPSTASLLTSLHPVEHGAGGRLPRFTRMDEDVATVVKSFRDAGYATHAVVNVAFLEPGTFGVTRDFDSVDHVAYESNVEVRPARETTEAALRWLDGRDDDRPVFLLVHYFDPHCVYAPPRTFRERWAAPEDRATEWTFGTREQMIAIRDGAYEPTPDVLGRAAALYDGEVAYLDAEIGRLDDGLRARGLAGDGDVLVLTSDHGEEFGEHGGFEHGHSLFDEVLRVPLVVRAPAALGPGVVDAPVRLIDVAPTLLELADLALPAQFVGRTLTPLARGEDDAPRPLLAHGNMWRGSQSAWIRGQWKVIVTESAPIQLFDLDADPAEQFDLAERDPDRAAAMGEQLTAAMRAMSAQKRGEEADVSPAMRDLLRGLGYGRSNDGD